MKQILTIGFIALSSLLFSCKKEVSHSNESQSAVSVNSSLRTITPSNLLWQKCLGTAVNDYGNGITRSADGTAYFIAGSTIDAGGHYDAYVVKTDLNGNVLRQKTFGGSGVDDAQTVVATGDGGCLVAGYTESNDGDVAGMNHGVADVLLLKYDSNLELVWKQTLGGSQYDRAFSLINTSDGNYALSGETGSNDGDVAGSGLTGGITKAWIVKLSAGSTGTAILWQKTYGIDGGKADVAYGICEQPGQGFCVTGRTLSTSNDADILAINISPQGDLLWRKSFGTVSAGDVGFSIIASPNNDGYVLTGYELTDLVVAKFDNYGSFASGWPKILLGSKAGGISGRSIIATSTGYVVIGGTSSKNGDIISAHGGQDFFAQQFGFDGIKVGSANVFGGSSDEIGKGVIINADGTFVAVGQTSSNNGDVSGNHGQSDAWLVKFKF